MRADMASRPWQLNRPGFMFIAAIKGACMASEYRIERDRGTKDAPQQLFVLRGKWRVAFPFKDQDVRPLAIGAASEIATAMGWSLPFTLGVLGRWKMASV